MCVGGNKEEHEAVSEREMEMIGQAVQDQLQNTFNDRNKRLFGSMIAALRQQDDEGKTDLKFGIH